MNTKAATRDLRDTSLYRAGVALYTTLRRPGSGSISDASEVCVAPGGTQAVFTSTCVETLEGVPPTRICHIDLESADIRILTSGPHVDRLPKYSPDGRQIAFLSDRHRAGDFQLYLLDALSGAVQPTPAVDGWVEYLHWSPDGRRILLGVAGHGADTSSSAGAVTSAAVADDLPHWMPTVASGDESYRWRCAWVYEVATGTVRKVSAPEKNVWEVVWCGNSALAAIASPGPGEGLWYSAHLHVIELDTGNSTELYVPSDQIGVPAASALGTLVAVVEAVCSDRWIVAGELRMIDTSTGRMRRVDTHHIDVSYTEWRSDRYLLVAGHRDFETVVGIYDAASDRFAEVWTSHDTTTAGRYVAVSGIDARGDFVIVAESFVRGPEIAVVRQGQYESVKSFDLSDPDDAGAIESVRRLSWQAGDGTDIQGWLLLPEGNPPYPLVMDIHGGPVWHWRPRWLGRAGLHTLMLVERGYAVLLPNPRGSSGRGQKFARRVLGDMGGVDTYDYLSGIDALVEQGLADPTRLGVTGISYGGFMASWLISQDSRFAAAVPVAPFTNQVTEHLLSNIPHFVSTFLADHYNNPNGKYFHRSPVMHAHKVTTPTLNICGALDRSAPPEEAIQFHNALIENGVTSVLVTYPEEGHGVRSLPAIIDYSVRIVSWFEEHMPSVRTGEHRSC